MLSSPDLSFSRTLPIVVFNQLRELLGQMAQTVGSPMVLTEAMLASVRIPVEWERQRFTVVISEHFSALLVGIDEGDEGTRGQGDKGTRREVGAEASSDPNFGGQGDKENNS